jgi:hypothetical protein
MSNVKLQTLVSRVLGFGLGLRSWVFGLRSWVFGVGSLVLGLWSWVFGLGFLVLRFAFCVWDFDLQNRNLEEFGIWNLEL